MLEQYLINRGMTEMTAHDIAHYMHKIGEYNRSDEFKNLAIKKAWEMQGYIHGKAEYNKGIKLAIRYACRHQW